MPGDGSPASDTLIPVSETQTQTWTTRKLLAWMQQAFLKAGLDAPRLLAEMLLAHVVGCERLKLYTDFDRPASPLERDILRDLAARALKHEPVQYLVGEAWFFGLPFKVDPRVLIPRPATESIVEEVLQHARAAHAAGGAGLLIADICTGSGCIGVVLLKRLAQARVIAADVCEGALALARENATRHDVLDRIDFLQGDLLAPLREHPPTRGPGCLDYLVSNPPYIPDDEWDAVAPNVKNHEPHGALRGGVDGLDFVRRLIEEGAPTLLRAGGLLLIEVADSRAAMARDLVAADPHLEGARIVRDFEGLDRVIVAQRRNA